MTGLSDFRVLKCEREKDSTGGNLWVSQLEQRK